MRRSNDSGGIPMIEHHHLPIGFQLAEYRIEKILGEGGFGLTYLAVDTHLNKPVAIKEYLPSDWAMRQGNHSVVVRHESKRELYEDGLQGFINEGKTLARFDDTNIVRVHRYIEANNTAYLVMEYCAGGSLADLLEQRGRLGESEVREFLARIMNSLQLVHDVNILHRDIKPANIMFRDPDTPVLIDFGAARQVTLGRSQMLSAIVTPGYAPPEQYSLSGKFGPWTDIYALAAVAYHCLTGERPLESTARIDEDRLQPLTGRLGNSAFLRALDKGLALRSAERPRTLSEWFASWSADVPGAEHVQDDRWSGLDDLLELAGVDGLLSAQEIDMLLGRASAQGIDQDEALRYITEQAHKRGWSLQSPEHDGAVKSLDPLIELAAVDGALSRQAVEHLLAEAGALGIKRRTAHRHIKALAASRGWRLLDADTAVRSEAPANAASTGATSASVNRPRKPSWLPWAYLAGVVVLAVPGFFAYRYFENYQVYSAKTEDSQLWYDARASGDLAAVENYLSQCGLCQYRDEANQLLAELQAQQGKPSNAVAERYPLRVEVSPPEARIRVMNIRETFTQGMLLPAGTYELEISHPGYQTIKGSAVLESVEDNFAVTLQPATASLESAEAKPIREQADQRWLADDRAAARDLYLKASAFGSAYADGQLATFYAKGTAVGKDMQIAQRYRQASESQLLVMAEQGDAQAQYLMGRINSSLLDQQNKASEWFRRAAEAGHVLAQGELGYHLEVGRGVSKSYSQAAVWYEKAARQGDFYSASNLGNFYRDGKGVTQNYAKAREWYQRAAEHQYGQAMNELGQLYEYGLGVPRDDAKAFDWYRKAARQGNAPGMNNLGRLYERGDGTAKSLESAADWYLKSAEKGDAGGQANLGRMYQFGRGLAANQLQAMTWYRKAAEQSNPDAQWRLGRVYEEGKGVQRDSAVAADWYRKSAEQGNRMGQYYLAAAYRDGIGVEKSYPRAREWFRKSAEQGDADAQYELGRLYELGLGGAQNRSEALSWYLRAKEGGNSAAEAALYNLEVLDGGADLDF